MKAQNPNEANSDTGNLSSFSTLKPTVGNVLTCTPSFSLYLGVLKSSKIIQNHVQSVQQISGFHRVVVLPAESCKRQVGDVQAKMLTNKRNRAHKTRSTVQANHDDAHLALSNEVPRKTSKSKQEVKYSDTVDMHFTV